MGQGQQLGPQPQDGTGSKRGCGMGMGSMSNMGSENSS